MSKIARDRIDIMSQILETANGWNVTKMQIMYKANLSYAQLKDYLVLLTEKDFLQYEANTQTFKATEKGLRFLRIYNHIGDMIMEEEEQPLQSHPEKMWIHS